MTRNSRVLLKKSNGINTLFVRAHVSIVVIVDVLYERQRQIRSDTTFVRELDIQSAVSLEPAPVRENLLPSGSAPICGQFGQLVP